MSAPQQILQQGGDALRDAPFPPALGQGPPPSEPDIAPEGPPELGGLGPEAPLEAPTGPPGWDEAAQSLSSEMGVPVDVVLAIGDVYQMLLDDAGGAPDGAGGPPFPGF